MNSSTRLQTFFLLLNAAGLTPIALSYGLAPEKSLSWLFGIDATGLNTRHIFRAIMGLYLAMICFWIAGAIRSDVRIPALWSLIAFMIGLGLGRLVSLVVDGWPNPLLVVYMVLEFILAAVALYLLRTETRDKA